jgi:hypothetical protein
VIDEPVHNLYLPRQVNVNLLASPLLCCVCIIALVELPSERIKNWLEMVVMLLDEVGSNLLDESLQFILERRVMGVDILVHLPNLVLAERHRF